MYRDKSENKYYKQAIGEAGKEDFNNLALYYLMLVITKCLFSVYHVLDRQGRKHLKYIS